jgi:hypothetical protein
MLVGSQTAFLSHLPMFDRLNRAKTDYVSPHRFQVILQTSFGRDGADVSDLYFADRRTHPEMKMFTVSPKPFVLPNLVGRSPLTTVQATIFRGHLERGGEPISGLDPVTLNVSRVVHFHKFDPAAPAPSTLEYLLFGRGPELFMAHLISKPPDFDQILSVTATGKQFTDKDLSTALRVSIPDSAHASMMTSVPRQSKTTAGASSTGLRLCLRTTLPKLTLEPVHGHAGALLYELRRFNLNHAFRHAST